MENLVIFASPLFLILLIGIILLHTSCALVRRFCVGKEEKGGKIANILSIVTMAVHIIMFICFIYLKVSGKSSSAVSPEEILFVLIISSTIALTASSAGKKEE